MDVVSTIVSNMNVEKLLDHYGFDTGNSDGEFFRSRCKIHGGDNPTAFVINIENGLWYCHTGGCEGGDIFSLVEKMEQVEFYDAVQFLVKFFDLNIEPGTPINRKPVDPNNYLKEIKNFIRIMKQSKKKELKPYTIDAEIQQLRRFRNFEYRTLRWFDAGYFERGTFQRSNETTYALRKRICIPIIQEGKQVGVSIRKTRSNQSPKWLHQPVGITTSQILYNFDDARSTDELVVTEGIFDVWGFHEIGVTAVATFGAGISREQQNLLLRTGATLIIAYDGDDAGRNASIRGVRELGNKADVYVIDFPDGSDPESVSRKELRALYDARIKGSQFIIKEKQRLR